MGAVPVNVAGRADFAGGLDFVAPREVTPGSVPRLAFRGFRGELDGDASVLTGHDLDAFHVRCDVPTPLQTDGEDLGDVTDVTFSAERDALTVLT
jgi:diacylglycerol kinase family enzyme